MFAILITLTIIQRGQDKRIDDTHTPIRIFNYYVKHIQELVSGNIVQAILVFFFARTELACDVP